MLGLKLIRHVLEMGNPYEILDFIMDYDANDIAFYKIDVTYSYISYISEATLCNDYADKHVKPPFISTGYVVSSHRLRWYITPWCVASGLESPLFTLNTEIWLITEQSSARFVCIWPSIR